MAGRSQTRGEAGVRGRPSDDEALQRYRRDASPVALLRSRLDNRQVSPHGWFPSGGWLTTSSGDLPARSQVAEAAATGSSQGTAALLRIAAEGTGAAAPTVGPRHQRGGLATPPQAGGAAGGLMLRRRSSPAGKRRLDANHPRPTWRGAANVPRGNRVGEAQLARRQRGPSRLRAPRRLRLWRWRRRRTTDGRARRRRVSLLEADHL